MKKIICLLSLLCVTTFAFAALPADDHTQCATPDSQTILKKAPTLDANILNLALKAYHRACDKHFIKVKNILTIIDYSKPSVERRFWVLDLNSNDVLIYTHVAHGKGSGDNYATYFSDQPRTDATSIGVFLTGEPYNGKHGYSLRLYGLEKGFNDAAYSRDIVIHSAWYVSHKFIKEYGKLGRSWGCPALEKKRCRDVINYIKNGSLLFAYYPDKKWLKKSMFLN